MAKENDELTITEYLVAQLHQPVQTPKITTTNFTNYESNETL